MRVVILTSNMRGVACRVLPVLHAHPGIDIADVIFAEGPPPNRKRRFRRKLDKTLKIGVLGAVNGVRIRKWYRDPDVQSIDMVCESLGIPLTRTPRVSCDTTRDLFRRADADLGLSLGNGYIPKSVFSIPRHGMVNVHTELLPAYQGAQSIIWPIYEGEAETGFTIHQIDNKIDTGEILHQVRYPITFRPTLEETVIQGMKTIRAGVPEAVAYVCEHYERLQREATPQPVGRTYTTPSYWQFRRMLKNHRTLYERSSQT